MGSQFLPTSPLPDSLLVGVNLTADEPLVPYPFLPSQYKLYTSLAPASRAFCDDEGADRYSFRLFSPDANVSAVGCSVHRSDLQLVRSCQSRRARGDVFGDMEVWKGEK